MALQSSGQISFGDINVELGLSRTTQISLGQSSVRTMNGVASGAIRLAADNYGKGVTANPLSFLIPGTYNFTVPNYVNLNVTVNGPGGGGSSGAWTHPSGFVVWVPGETGTESSFNSSTPLIAYSGTGGSIDNAGSNGSGIGGTVVVGGGASGGPGGAGSPPGQPGGYGGNVTKTWTYGSSGAPSPGQTITVIVGSRGLAGTGPVGPGTGGSPGSNGSVIISWS